MTATPWGEAETLAARKLKPGPGGSREEVMRNQRERLMGATVAVVSELGYEATRVEDILVMAGVSRNAFYRQFSSKLDCFVQTLEEIAHLARPTVIDVVERAEGPWDERLEAMLDALAATLIAQPAVARVAWVEVYVAGPPAIAVIEGIDEAVVDTACRALRESPERAGMPRDVVRAIVGGVRHMVHARVREDRLHELPALMGRLLDWMRSYRTPPERLRRPRRVPEELRAPRAAPVEPRDRILAAITEIVAERGYSDMAITEIATRASVSLTTFYGHFDGKEDAFRATLVEAQTRLFEAVAPHVSTGAAWAPSLSVAAYVFFGYLATAPETAYLGGMGVWGTTAAGLESRAEGIAAFRTLLEEGYRLHPDVEPAASEAIGASIDALLFRTLRHKSAQRLYEVAPTAAFLALTPFVGPERACALANAAPLVGATSAA